MENENEAKEIKNLEKLLIMNGIKEIQIEKLKDYYKKAHEGIMDYYECDLLIELKRQYKCTLMDKERNYKTRLYLNFEI